MPVRRGFLIAAALAVLGSGAVSAQTAPRPPAGEGDRVEAAPRPSQGRGTIGMSYMWNGGVTYEPGKSILPPGVYPVITVIQPGSAAARAGLAVGDVILSSDGRDASHGRLFPNWTPGTKYVLRIRRGQEEREISVVVAPPAPAAAAP